jgi:PAS domain S-box-containing protein
MSTQFLHKARNHNGFSGKAGAVHELSKPLPGRPAGDPLPASAVDHLAPAIFIVTAKGPECPIVYVSNGFAVTTRYTAEDALGRDLALLQGPNTSPATLELIRETMARGKRFHGELLCYRKDAPPAWCELTLAPLFGPDGSLHFAGLLTDISAHKRREAQLENSEAKYRGMFENAVEGIYQSTPDGRYLTVNTALARMYGYDQPGELLREVSDIQNQIYVDPGLRQEFQREIELTGFVDSREYQVRRRDGKIIWISESARVVRGPEGAVLYYEGFIDDITARKDAEAARTRLEKQMVQAQKMEAVGTLAGGIAHDFNNILCAMVGFTELVLAERTVKGAARENLEAVLHSTSRATDLVKRILTFSRRTETDRRPLRLGEIIKECVKLLNASLPSYIQINPAYHTSDDIVMADVTEMHQVIMNLGSNAAHAMRPKGGRLDFELEAVDLPAVAAAALSLPAGPYLSLVVRDTGHGMSRAVMENIFDPFFTTKPVGQGTGLGLTLVHKIVSGSGGHIAVESQVGRGTTFRIHLPRLAQSVLAAQPDQKEIRPGNHERILVVDDEIPILMMMQQRLRKLGYRVMTRADSLGALDAFRAEPEKFSLVITDHTMPGLQGADLAEKLGEIRADIPVILMTGLNHPPDLTGSRHARHRTVVQKPINFVELSRQMRDFLDQPDTPSAP